MGCARNGPPGGEDGGGDAGNAEDAGRGDAAGDSGEDAGLAWPNAESAAASEPWLLAHHDEITVMRPRILALNFVNARTMEQMDALLQSIIAAIREGTRDHGYDDASAKPFLEYQVAYAVDLRDHPAPSGWTKRNSTKYPRENPVDGYWGFDYERLFTQEFADLYGVPDPDHAGRKLTLCELNARGLVHEVWIYGDADVPDVSAAEVLGLMPPHDAAGHVVAGAPLDRCAGNGCFDEEDTVPPECTRTLRIGWVNNTRGVGCYLESLSHGIESIGNHGLVPAWTPLWKSFAQFDLNTRFGLPFDSWYACGGSATGQCLSYPTSRSVHYDTGAHVGTLDPYVPTCGNAHLPPNARNHYDIVNAGQVDSTCRGWRQGGGAGGADAEAPVSAADWAQYQSLAPDCTGAWLVWWWQNFNGPARRARATDGEPLQNWWPYLFY